MNPQLVGLASENDQQGWSFGQHPAQAPKPKAESLVTTVSHL